MDTSLDVQIRSTKLLNKLQAAKTRFVINYGGAGSSKSYTQAQHEILRGLQDREKVLVIRKVATTLKDSVVSLMVDQIIPDMGLASWFIYNKSTLTLINKLTGSTYIFRGMDDPEKIKSVAGITRIWIEEASELDEPDFKQLNLRLRGVEGGQITLTFNPIDEGHWLKKRFVDSFDPDRMTLIKTTYLNNPFLDADYIRELEKEKNDDFEYYRIYALGEWGKLDLGAELYKSFSPINHVRPIQYDPDLPLHLSFDENVNPYPALAIWQAEGPRAWQIGEITLEAPRNTLQDTLTEFKKQYYGHSAQVYIYGDATSRKSDTKLERGYNYFRLIEEGLQDFSPITRVPAANPSVMIRALFINRILQGRVTNSQGELLEISIAESCKLSIEDFRYIKEASDGGKLKEKIRNPITKVQYEPRGHLTDVAEYFLTQYFLSDFQSFKSGGGSKGVNYLLGRTKMRREIY